MNHFLLSELLQNLARTPRNTPTDSNMNNNYQRHYTPRKNRRNHYQDKDDLTINISVTIKPS